MLIHLNTYQIVILSVLLLLNIFTCTLFYIDKRKAKTNGRRIPEKTLLFFTFALGGIGAWVGMKQFRHKTKHLSFKIAAPIAGMITLSVIYWVFNL